MTNCPDYAIIDTERERTREENKMINIRTIRKLKDNEGLTLKKGNRITYKSGYQVATHGVEVTTAEETISIVKACGGTCGVWYSGGIYYIDYSKRIATKREAVALGRACNQQSILKWNNMALVWLT